MDAPRDIDLKKDESLAIVWGDGSRSVYPIAHLRRMSPSADMRELRKQMQNDPLAVLPDRQASTRGIAATGAELVGNYALRITFSDGHRSGIYTWEYLRSIDPESGGDERADREGPQ